MRSRLERSTTSSFLFDQLLLQPLAAQTEEDALLRAVLVIVSVSVGPWPLLKGHVQRVRVQPGE